jgi:hypothetical protein
MATLPNNAKTQSNAGIYFVKLSGGRFVLKIHSYCDHFLGIDMEMN